MVWNSRKYAGGQMPIQRVEEWYAQCGESIYRRCQRILRDNHEAWDVTQDVFIRAHRAADSFRGDTSVLSWLLTIADRCCFTSLKKRRRVEPVDAMELEQVTASPGESVEQLLVRSDLVSRLLERFEEQTQQIVVLRFFDEMEQEQIAVKLEISRKTVQRKLDRFLEDAAKILKRWADTRPAHEIARENES